ncbi:MAG TPA: hypothetical protein ENI88_05725 [Desulfobulbus sp.]|nr:hypothetical protein [Desulfobulbus sp.]
MENKAIGSLTHRFLNLFPLCNAKCHQYVISILWLLLFLFPFQQYYSFQLELTQWDLLFFTGILAFILGLNLVEGLNDRFTLTLNRLITRGIIKVDAQRKKIFFNHLERHAQDWARIGGIVAAILILGAFTVVLINDFYWQMVLLAAAESMGGYIAGNYLGRMVGYGLLGRQLIKESIRIETQPSHVDGVAGLKPIGDYYFHQASILAIPAIFLAVWWLLFPIWPRDYSHWENAYLALLSISIVIEILGFIVPLWSFHRIMVKEKARWLTKADELSRTINTFQAVPEGGRPREVRKLPQEQVEMMRKYYWSIENMTTWPVDIKTRGRFRLNNILLFIPLLGDIIKRTFDWKHILSLLKQLG